MEPDSGKKKTIKKFDKFIQDTSVYSYIIIITLLIAILVLEFIIILR